MLCPSITKSPFTLFILQTLLQNNREKKSKNKVERANLAPKWKEVYSYFVNVF